MLPACLFSSFADQSDPSDRDNRSKMAANVRTEMRIPTRVAPRPPQAALMNHRNSWNSSTNDFMNGSLNTHPPQKKKPPPRPPPPKFVPSRNQNDKNDRSKKPQRPTELLTNLFGRKPSKTSMNASYSYSNSSNRTPGSSSSTRSATPNGPVCLIDLSPPRSPTLTTRSNSDGVSVDSFGSDGNSNPSMFTNSGNTSQTESAFEDDFDFFASISSNHKSSDSDPWKLTGNQDPFSPMTRNQSAKPTKVVGNSTFVSFDDDNFGETNNVPSVSSTMPTIIRAKPAKPPAPKIYQSSLAPTVTQFHPKPTPKPRITVPYNEPVTLDVNPTWTNFEEEPSPPMPSIPPPAPPPLYLAEIDNSTVCSGEQDRANEYRESPVTFKGNRTEPYGIALYDFPAMQPNDLGLKAGDVVTLVQAVNDDWLEGRIGNRQGMFPTNFVDIKVPLPGLSTNIVNALYTFHGETEEDLPFEAGAKIEVLSRISDDWLFGEYGGKRGQFPANYVDRVPTSFS